MTASLQSLVQFFCLKIANNCYKGDQIEGMTASQYNVLELVLIFSPFLFYREISGFELLNT